MTCEQCSEFLGETVDGTLDAEHRAAIDAHVRDCAACRGLLNDLTNIRAAAATLERRTPSPEVWRAISAHVDHNTSAPQSRWFTRLAAAAALLMVLGSAAWFGLSREWRGGDEGATSELARSAASELQLAEQHYQNAITALEQLTVDKDNALDPSVAAEIAQSLASIDRAIDDSRAALKSEPDSFVAQTSLLEALRMKVALLQETVSLMNARS
jgi:predicted anti-sigma-YlaC factor YlaD